MLNIYLFCFFCMLFCNTTKLVNLSLERTIKKCDLYCNHSVSPSMIFVIRTAKTHIDHQGAARGSKQNDCEDKIKLIIALPVNRFSTLAGAAV